MQQQKSTSTGTARHRLLPVLITGLLLVSALGVQGQTTTPANDNEAPATSVISTDKGPQTPPTAPATGDPQAAPLAPAGGGQPANGSLDQNYDNGASHASKTGLAPERQQNIQQKTITHPTQRQSLEKVYPDE